MAIDERIAGMQEEMTKWRRKFHAHPELGFDETRTAHATTGRCAPAEA